MYNKIDNPEKMKQGFLFAQNLMGMSYKQRAMKLFREGYNCSQSVFGAFFDEYDLDIEQALRLSSSFGGGMGRLREVCGAVTGMFMVAGLKYGYSNPDDDIGKTEHYTRIQFLAKEFYNQNDSIICRELLGLDEGIDSPVPEKRSDTYYETRPCEELIGRAAEIMEKYIKNNK
jgi:C_GCAxxG_C_C family probable redox protein